MKIGVIGCGRWGKNHIRVFQELGHPVLEVADPVRENVDQIRQRYPLINATTHYEDLLKNKDVEAVAVVTPTDTHAEVACAALAAGKHVLLEKPLAKSVAEARKILDAAEKNKRVLMVGHTFLYNNSVRKMKELARSKETGQVYYLVSRRNHAGSIREDVNVMWDLTPHDISIFSYVLEEQPSWVTAVGGSYLKPPRSDVVFMTLGYPSGALGNVQVSWVDAGKVREVVVIGSQRRIVFDDLKLMEPIRVYDKGVATSGEAHSFGEFQYMLRDGDILSPKVEIKEPLKMECQHFVDCVQENRTPLTDGQNGLQVVKVLEAAEQSLREKGKPVEIS